MSLVEMARAVHIVAGSIALTVMWVPMLAAKGGRLHRRAGLVFVGAMAVVSSSGVGLSVYRLLTETRPGVRLASAFLLYVSILTGAGALKGVRVLRTKRRTGPNRNPVDLAAAGLVLVSGAAMGLAGLWFGQPLLLTFSLIGIAGGVTDLKYWLRSPDTRMHWWFEHMADMLGTGIAALTAFAVVNSPRLGLPSFSLLVWLGPSLVGVPAIVVWSRHYRRRFAGRAGPAAPVSAAARTGGVTRVGETSRTRPVGSS